MTVKRSFTWFPSTVKKMKLKQKTWKLLTAVWILPSTRRLPGLLINSLLGYDTCCCLPNSGAHLACWPPQDKYSAFRFLIGIPGGSGGGAWRKSHQNVEVLPSSLSEVHQPIMDPLPLPPTPGRAPVLRFSPLPCKYAAVRSHSTTTCTNLW